MHAMSSSQIRVHSQCTSVFKCKFMCMCVLGVQESGTLIAFARLPTLKRPLPWRGKRFLTTLQNGEGWGIQQKKKDMRQGSKVGGSGHLGEEELPKQLPSFIWPTSSYPMHTCSLSPSFSLTNTQIHAASPPPHVLKCGPHRG